MIRYDHLWQTMEKNGITQYKLIKQYHFSAGQIGRLKKNMHVSTRTLDTLCTILNCTISDIVEFVPDGSPLAGTPENGPTGTSLSDAPESSPAGTSPAASPLEAAPSEKPKKAGKAKKAEKKGAKGGKKGKKNK